MITLLTYPQSAGQFSLSPFCVKAAFLLNASGLKWRREDINNPGKMPFQKLPVLRDGTELIPDSDNIRSYLESKGAVFDAGLTDVQKAHARALIRMAEEHLYFHLVLDRWGNDTVWPTIRETYFYEVPAFMRKFVANGLRKSVLRGLKTQGLGRFTAEQRLERIEPDLVAVMALLWENTYLLGDRPTAADFSVGAMLSAIRATPVETPLRRRVSDDAILSAYIDRLGQPEAPV
jgi:glutathione S-transferase